MLLTQEDFVDCSGRGSFFCIYIQYGTANIRLSRIRESCNPSDLGRKRNCATLDTVALTRLVRRSSVLWNLWRRPPMANLSKDVTFKWRDSTSSEVHPIFWYACMLHVLVWKPSHICLDSPAFYIAKPTLSFSWVFKSYLFDILFILVLHANHTTSLLFSYMRGHWNSQVVFLGTHDIYCLFKGLSKSNLVLFLTNYFYSGRLSQISVRCARELLALWKTTQILHCMIIYTSQSCQRMQILV